MVSPARSKIMSSIRSKDTRPELYIRRIMHNDGFRFRLHYPKLPGRPDIVLPKYRSIILVNGCFWHGHDCHIFNPKIRRSPEWERKIERNRERDRENLNKYREMGWKCLIVWECAIQGKTRLLTCQIKDRIHNWILKETSDGSVAGHLDNESTSDLSGAAKI